MILSKFSYSVGQARKNMVRNGLMTVASLFTISSCLLILGLFTALSMNVNFIADQIKDQCEVQVFISQEANEARVVEICDEILANPNVKEISLFTKEDMLRYAQQDMYEGHEELLDFENDNPFHDSYKIRLVDISKSAETVQEFKTIRNVHYVANMQEIVDQVLNITNMVQKASLVIMALLILVAIVIIANTIKLTVFNRRKEINIMKYIGATDRFIRVPFVLEGVMIGFLGAVVTFGLISWGYVALASMLENGFELFQIVSYAQVAPVFAGVFVVVGCLIGVLGSTISVRRYLKV